MIQNFSSVEKGYIVQYSEIKFFRILVLLRMGTQYSTVQCYKMINNFSSVEKEYIGQYNTVQ